MSGATSRRNAAFHWLGLGALSTVVLTVGFRLPLPAVGPTVSTLGALLGAAVLVIALLVRGNPPAYARAARWPILGAAVLLSTHAIGLVVAEHWELAARADLKLAIGLALLLGLWSRAPAEAVRLRRYLAYCAAFTIGVAALAALCGLLVPELRDQLFVQTQHERLGDLPRLRAFGGSPAGLGYVLLPCIGLARSLPNRHQRTAFTVLGSVLVLLTLSLASLAVTLLVVWRIGRRPWVRAVGLATLLVAVSAVLLLRAEEGAGGFTIVPTARGELAEGALRCALDHPLLGVGSENFRFTCPVEAEDTYGRAGPHRVHHAYLGLLAEHGLVGLFGLILLIASMRRTRWATDDPVARGALVALGVCALSGPVLQLPIMFVLAGMVLEPASAEAPEAGGDA